MFFYYTIKFFYKKSIFYNQVILGRDYDIMSGEVNINENR